MCARTQPGTYLRPSHHSWSTTSRCWLTHNFLFCRATEKLLVYASVYHCFRNSRVLKLAGPHCRQSFLLAEVHATPYCFRSSSSTGVRMLLRSAGTQFLKSGIAQVGASSCDLWKYLAVLTFLVVSFETLLLASTTNTFYSITVWSCRLVCRRLCKEERNSVALFIPAAVDGPRFCALLSAHCMLLKFPCQGQLSRADLASFTRATFGARKHDSSLSALFPS